MIMKNKEERRTRENKRKDAEEIRAESKWSSGP
jgi:hypothetical protein